MAVYQAKMERKQGFLFRCVDVVMELFAMAATVSRARQHARRRATPRREQRARARRPLLPRRRSRKVQRLFRDLWSNDDALKNTVAASVMRGGTPGSSRASDIGLTPEAFKTKSLVAMKKRLAGEAA